MKDRLESLPLSAIIPSAHNPRVVKPGDPAVAELAKSIAEVGLVQPIVCRPHPDHRGKFELLAGRRRYEACRLNKARTILAIVRALGDKAAIEVTILENLQRQNLTPIEEARGIQALLDIGHSAREIAADLGKGYVWVYRRANLTKLSPAVVAAVESGQFPNLGAMHLEVLAKLPPDRQDHILAECAHMLDGRFSAAELEETFLADAMALSAARWPMDEAYADMQPCRGCTRRTDHQPELFHSENDSRATIEKNARCLDPVCWRAKSTACQRAAIQAARHKHGPALLLAGAQVEGEDHTIGYVRPDSIVKKSTPGARPCLVLDRPGGHLVYLSPDACPDSAPEPTELGTPAADRRAQHILRVIARALRLADPPFMSLDGAALCAAVFGTATCHSQPLPETWETLRKLRDAPSREVCHALWDLLRPVFLARVKVSSSWPLQASLAEAREVASMLGLDLASIEAAALLKFPDQDPAPAAPPATTPDETLSPDQDIPQELYDQALAHIRATRRASLTSLQRRLRIGYTRGARLMDLLEERGVVGPAKGADPREILIDLDAPASTPAAE